MRDFSALFTERGECILCGAPRIVWDAHGEVHLADGSAIVVIEKIRGVRSERVLPMSSVGESPEESGIAPMSLLVGPRKLDKKLAKIVRTALANQKGGAA